MNIKINKKIKSDSGFLVLPIFREEIGKYPASYPQALKPFFEKRVKSKEFSGKKGEIIDTYLDGKNLPPKAVLVGFGKKEKFNSKKARRIAGIIGKFLKKKKNTEVTIVMPEIVAKYAEEFVEGLKMSQYKIDKYKTCKKVGCPTYELERLEIVVEKESGVLEKAVAKGDLIAESVHYVRDLVNGPSNIVSTEYMALEAKKLVRENGYKIAVFGDKELEEMGWGGLLAVNAGSPKEAKCVVLEYDGGSKKEKPIVLVGKGIMFDSGGYNIKPRNHIESMHQDMAGAAVVLGVFKLLKKLGVKKNVAGVIPLAENMINEKAYRPSDIVTMYSGMTVEITNTDAEGRLILADGVTYATELNPDCIITVATLTGAVKVALGDRYSGVMGNDLTLRAELYHAGRQTDDLVWPLPMHRDFKKKLDSEVADVTNGDVGTASWAGAQKGAAFVERFVKKNKWCHVDIGGTAYCEDVQQAFETKGATGHGLRMLVRFLENRK
ncbi:MAG: leucyl aminopeptidase [Candidatus Gracilibacteria bacterium]|jgi:leucyl aminopeptidase